MVQWKKSNKDENNDYLWELTTKQIKVNIVNGFDEKIRKHYRGNNKGDIDYKHEDVEKSLLKAIGEKLEVEGKAAKVDLKKILSKRRINTK